MPSLMIFVPFLFLAVVNFPIKFLQKKSGYPLVLLASVIQVVLSCVYIKKSDMLGNDLLNNIFVFKLCADPLSLVMLLTIGMVIFVTAMVGWSMIEDIKKKFNFINLLFVALIGMNSLVMVSDLFTLYVFIEVTAISAFILIGLNRDTHALEGAFKYMIMSMVATVFMLSGIALMLLVSGDTSFGAINKGISGLYGNYLIKIAVILFLSGLFIKSGAVPFHGWLADAYSASPTPVSLLLAGIVTKITGVYALIRIIIGVYGVNNPVNKVVMLVGAISIVVGAILAMTQTNFKRMLAYSSISQVGYIILAIGCASKMALIGAVFHLFNHATFKTLLFANVAAIEKSTGRTNLSQLGGLQAKMPITGLTSIFGFLSTAGIPPFSGFWSKLIIIVALWTANQRAYAILALMASILTLGYLLIMQRKLLFGKIKEGLEEVREAGMGLLIPQIILALVTFIVGVCFPIFYNMFLLPLGSLIK